MFSKEANYEDSLLINKKEKDTATGSDNRRRQLNDDIVYDDKIINVIIDDEEELSRYFEVDSSLLAHTQLCSSVLVDTPRPSPLMLDQYRFSPVILEQYRFSPVIMDKPLLSRDTYHPPRPSPLVFDYNKCTLSQSLLIDWELMLVVEKLCSLNQKYDYQYIPYFDYSKDFLKPTARKMPPLISPSQQRTKTYNPYTKTKHQKRVNEVEIFSKTEELTPLPELAPISMPDLAPISFPDLASISIPDIAPVSFPDLAPISMPHLAPISINALTTQVLDVMKSLDVKHSTHVTKEHKSSFGENTGFIVPVNRCLKRRNETDLTDSLDRLSLTPPIKQRFLRSTNSNKTYDVIKQDKAENDIKTNKNIIQDNVKITRQLTQEQEPQKGTNVDPKYRNTANQRCLKRQHKNDLSDSLEKLSLTPPIKQRFLSTMNCPKTNDIIKQGQVGNDTKINFCKLNQLGLVGNNTATTIKPDQAGNNTKTTIKQDQAGNNTKTTIKQDRAGNNTANNINQDQAGNNTATNIKQDQAGNNTANIIKQDQAGNNTANNIKQEQAGNNTATNIKQEQAGNNTATNIKQEQAGNNTATNIKQEQAGSDTATNIKQEQAYYCLIHFYKRFQNG